MILFEEKYLFLKYIFHIYCIYIPINTFSCYITYAFSEQQKINSGFFLFEAEQKAKKAKKSIAGKRCMHQPKQNETNVNIQNILTAHSSDESTLTDESLNS